MMKNPFRVEDEKDRRLVMLAVIFLMVAVILFSWQISSSIENLSGERSPIPGTQEEVDQNIINAKAYLEDIGTELDSIASLL